MKFIRIGQLFLMAAIACAALPGKAAFQGDFDPKTISPSTELVTPSVKWLTSSAEAPLKVLFIVANIRMREVVELAQRMDLNYQVAAIVAIFIPTKVIKDSIITIGLSEKCWELD